jgi:hypothetical protein
MKCDYCKKSLEGLPYKCRYCRKDYCSKHRLPENHNCKELEQLKKDNPLRWKKEFEEEFFPNREEHNSSEKPVQYKLSLFSKPKAWLNEREHNKYNFIGRLNYLVTTVLILAAFIVGFSIFYNNAQKLNGINLWIIKLGGVLILTFLFFIIKFGWRLGRELIDILKRQRNWIKYLIIIFIAILLWHSYTHRDTIMDPIVQVYNRTNFSLFSPLDFRSVSSGVTGEVAGNSNYLPDDIVSDQAPSIEDNFPDINKLHWSHMPLVYKFSEELHCEGASKKRILMAFNEIKSSTNGSVDFIEGENYDLLINCYSSTKDKSYYEGDYRYDFLGEAITDYTEGGNIILNASINFYPFRNSCGYFPFIEIHEILHTFNYQHNDQESCSIMASVSNCRFIYENPDICEKPHIDEDIVYDLIKTYQNLRGSEKLSESDSFFPGGLNFSIRS